MLHADFEAEIENQQCAGESTAGAELAKQDSLPASTAVTRLKQQLDAALACDSSRRTWTRRVHMGTFDANLAVAEKEHAAAYKLNKNLLTRPTARRTGVMEYVT